MSKKFSFKEFDLEGMQTLEAISAAPRLNDWMYNFTSKNLKGNILEVGSGIGNISSRFMDAERTLHLSDVRENYIAYLDHQFGNNPYLGSISKLDLVHPDFDNIYSNLLNSFDGIFALNVIEHIEDDLQAIANCKKLLRKGGRLVILVPAYQSLYNSFDTALEHYRRYNKQSLSKLFLENELNIERSQYFNFVGIFGWYFSGNILKKEILPKGQMKVYNTLVPVFKLIDKLVLNQFGLSVIVEGIKK